jgi:hypothetical protein
MTYMIPGDLKSIQYLKTTHTSMQSSSNSGNTLITLTGSEISYTPFPDSEKVVYEISFYAENSGYPFVCCHLEHADAGNTNWTEINAKYKKNIGVGGITGQLNRYYIAWRFVLPSWSGEKQLRIRIGSHNSNRSLDFHKIKVWDGAGANDKFCDTNLLVYSI